MLGRRDFLKMLGLVGVGLVLPEVPDLAAPRTKVFQLDKTMLAKPLDVMVAEATKRYGKLTIDGRVVGYVNGWALDQRMSHGLYSRKVVSLEAELAWAEWNIDLQRAYEQASSVSAALWTGNGMELTVTDMHITEAEYRPDKVVVSGMITSYGGRMVQRG